MKKSFLNLTLNFLSMVVSTGLSFWITPFVINTMGAESYGFVPLTQQMINYLSVITLSITSISGRFFTIAKKRENLSLAQEYFSSAVCGSIAGSLILSAIIVTGALYIDRFINIPPYLTGDVRLSFLLYGAIFLISFVTSCFNVGAFSNNKLYITSSISIVNSIVKTFTTVGLLLMFTPRIWYISLGALAAAVVAMIITVFAFTRLEPCIKIFRLSVSRLGEMLMSGVWASFGEIGAMLFLQIDLLVANWNLGPSVSGRYAVVTSLPSILRTMSSVLISVFVPTVISFFAVGKIKEMIRYINNAVKYTGFALSLPIGIVCGLGNVFLGLWINPDYAVYGFVLSVLTIHLAINLPVQVIMSVQTAYNKLKTPACVTFVMGVANFIMAFLLTKYSDAGIMGLAITGGVVLTAKNAVFTPLYVAKITGQKWNTYFKGVLKPTISTSFVAVLSYLSQKIYSIKNFYELALVCCVIGVLYLAFVYFAMLDKEERGLLLKGAGEFFGKG
jgi:membrane protein EpsK